MTSLRHTRESSELRDLRDLYLDAARSCLLDLGWRRTTLTEVARRAGVARMTIYRTWADMPTLLGDLMTREWAGVLGSAADGDDPDLVGRLVLAVRTLRENELFVRIVEVDPELLLPYLLARRGRSQDLVLSIAEAAIREGQAAGTVRVGDATAIARGLLLAVHGFVLSSQTMLDGPEGGVDEAALDAELTHLLTCALAP